jgi:hypothetical protein
MSIVSFVLRFGHTFYVLAWMMLFLGGSVILTPPPTGRRHETPTLRA